MKQLLSIIFLGATCFLYSCQKEFSIEGAGIAGSGDTNSGTSAGSLGGTPGACANAVVNGVYAQGVSLTDSTKYLTVSVTITTPGTYTIGTDTVNGIYFLKSGTFTDSGTQSVTLKAFGTPANPGLFTNTVKYKGSSCSFEVEVLAVATPNGTDYFPTTTNSNWTYKDLFSTDTFRVTATGVNRDLAGNTYTTFFYDNGSSPDSFFYRKGSGLYYQYFTDLAGSGVGGEYIFLKDNVPVNTQWESAEYIINTPPIVGKAKFRLTIIEKNTTKVVGSKAFANTIVVKQELLFSLAGAPYITTENSELWYAKGIGMINQIDASSPFTTELTRYQVF
ncbi:MAG: hypothetical protein ABIX01_15165 [Chitinophagaceae bacterium]